MLFQPFHHQCLLFLFDLPAFEAETQELRDLPTQHPGQTSTEKTQQTRSEPSRPRAQDRHWEQKRLLGPRSSSWRGCDAVRPARMDVPTSRLRDILGGSGLFSAAGPLQCK